MESYTYRVIIEPDEGGYHASVPALPGCHTWGKTINDARTMIRDAIDVYVRSLIADGGKIPHDRGLELFETISAPKPSKRTKGVAYA
ncbi:MAG: type II toxin-antitoxin system HicB family antitoxin [Minisyncoccia bacterium]|jgi:predicted RNase H-like HicB family nuclease